MYIQTFSNERTWLSSSVKFFAEAVSKNAGPIALSGGNTPIPVYEAIARGAIMNRHGIEVYQVDERYVPTDDPRSNQKLIMDHFILPATERADAEGTYSPYCCFTPMHTDIPIEKAAKKYEKSLRWIQPACGGFSLIILGIGHDGHTASLFPHSPVLQETKHLVASTQFPLLLGEGKGEVQAEQRLTLTFPVILASKNILILMRGEDKQLVIDELFHGTKTIDEFPAKRLLEHAQASLLYLT